MCECVWVYMCLLAFLYLCVCACTSVRVLESESMRGKDPQPSQDGVRSVGDSSCVGGESMNNMQSYAVDELCYERGRVTQRLVRVGWERCQPDSQRCTALQDIWSNTQLSSSCNARH